MEANAEINPTGPTVLDDDIDEPPPEDNPMARPPRHPNPVRRHVEDDDSTDEDQEDYWYLGI